MTARLGRIAWPPLLVVAACQTQAAQPANCESLLGTTIEGATISVAALRAATADLPQHCEIVGALNEHTGLDGQRYAIRFRLRMPTDWNSRFFYQGGGGTDGNLGDANAPQIQQGYAVVSTDSGHDNATNISPVAGTFEFGYDPQARSDYGYNGPAQVTIAAKACVDQMVDGLGRASLGDEDA